MIRRIVISVALLLGGCAGVIVETPSGFVDLDANGRFDRRAVTADGVVFAVRRIDNDPRAPLSFWTDVVRDRLVGAGGYALTEERPLRAASGEEGRQLRLGRAENGHAYVYWVTLFTSGDHLLLVEAGGRRDRFEAVADEVARSIDAVHFD